MTGIVAENILGIDKGVISIIILRTDKVDKNILGNRNKIRVEVITLFRKAALELIERLL